MVYMKIPQPISGGDYDELKPVQFYEQLKSANFAR